ncbi:MAG: hypothetical protein AB7E55_25090 [Pigmentiphaga sp.]
MAPFARRGCNALMAIFYIDGYLSGLEGVRVSTDLNNIIIEINR